MKKKWVKKLIFSLGVLLCIFLLCNLALNIWLKTQLPNYIKNNTDYKVSYKRLDVDLITGNIFVSQITVNNKNPENNNVIGLQGTIDTLKISRFGIYDALFHKIISSSDLLLAKPNLNITLAKPVDSKTGKKRNPVSFENIRISNGTINVYKHTKQNFLGVSHLDLLVENLQLTEESVENKLPIIFDQYSIKGKNFFFQPDDIYTLKIKTITTVNGQMSIENFQMVPLMSFDQFKKSYPKKTQLYQFNIPKMDFKDIVLKKNKISLANAKFQNPDLLIYTTNAIPEKLKKPFNFELNLDDIVMNNATVQINKPDGEKLLYAKQVHLDINHFEFDKEISKETIPLRYKDFKLSGKNIWFSNHQDITVESISLTPKKGDIRNISIVPNPSGSGKTTMNLKAEKLAFNINKWEIIDKKLNLNVKDVLLNNVNGSIKAGTSLPNKKSNFDGIQFPIVVGKMMVKNSSITYDKNSQPITLNDLNATINHIELNAKPNHSGMAVTMKAYSLTAKNFGYKTRFYHMTSGWIELHNDNLKINQFAMKPLVSRSQFIRMIPVESDLYDLKAQQISAVGNWDLFSDQKFIHAKNLTILSADANIFRSKVPADDPKEKLLYSRLLRSIKIPLFVDNLNLKNAFLEYEEDTPKSSGPGKLTFSSMNMNVKNLNSAKMKGKPTKVNIKIDCTFMKTSPLSVNWSFDTADQSDRFSISGRAAGIPAVAINAFIVPYLSVSATGTIQEMLFDFKGNPKGIGGTFNLKHTDLKVSILDKESKEKKGVLSAVANIFIKSDSGKFPESVVVEGVERDPTKSFFNLFWKGIEDGLKKTLIGNGIAKTEKTVKNTVNAVKEVKAAVNETVPPKEEKKKGLLKRVFNKKESSGTK